MIGCGGPVHDHSGSTGSCFRANLSSEVCPWVAASYVDTPTRDIPVRVLVGLARLLSQPPPTTSGGLSVLRPTTNATALAHLPFADG